MPIQQQQTPTCTLQQQDEQQITPDNPCQQAMLKLHAMVWQQQASKAVVEATEALDMAHGPAAQEAVLQVLTSLVCQAAPPSTPYLARLLKQLISAAEDSHQELSEALLQLHTALLLQGSQQQTEQDEATWRYKTFYYSSDATWAELQELQRHHHQHIQSAACSDGDNDSNNNDTNSSTSSSNVDTRPPSGHADNNTPLSHEHGWTLPGHLQQRLLQRQQALQHLLSAMMEDSPVGCTQHQHQHQPRLMVDGRPAGPTQQQQRQQQQLQRQQPGAMCHNNNTAAQPSLQPLQPQEDCQLSTHGCLSRPDSSSDGGGCPSIAAGAAAAGGGGGGGGLITVHCSDNMFEGGTGCHLWDAGFLLAEFVLNSPQLFEGRRVLEIGCGPGLVATCLCRSGASRVLLTDGDPQTLVNCLSNLRMNGHSNSRLLGSWREAAGFVQTGPSGGGSSSCSEEQQHQVLACPLDWHEDVPGLSADVILGSDICYDPEAVPSLVRLLAQLLLPQTHERPSCTSLPAGMRPVAYISTTKRQDSTLQLFLDLCVESGLIVEEVAREGGAVAFQELPALHHGQGTLGRRQYVLHRVTSQGCSSSCT